MRSLYAVLIFSSTMLGVLHADSLDVKPGQWEATVTMQTSGMPPIDTSKMSPEVRAKVEAAMKQRQGSHTSTNKTCVTKEQIDKGLDFGQSPTCKRTLLSSTRTMQEMKIECTKPNSTSTVKIEALSSESIKGTMKIAATDGTHTMNMDGTFTSKWIGPCPPEGK